MNTIFDVHPLRFRSLEEWEQYKDGKVPMSSLVQPLIVSDGKLIKNPEYEDLPFELTWITQPISGEMPTTQDNPPL
jgi:hypothetical protein